VLVEVPDDVLVAEVAKWAIVKDDLSPKEMFKMQDGTSADRAVIARYCVQDCQLVLDLFKKLEVFNNSMSMANVSSVPVPYIFLRGQGVKIESLMYKYCYTAEQCIEVLPGGGDGGEKYEGAIVLDPTPGFYTVPVGVADFASLYPSTIISENISHDTLVWVKDYTEDGNFVSLVYGSDEYDGLEGVAYTDIEYDNFIDDPEDERKHKRQLKKGIRVCRYAQNKMGTIPLIVQGLLAARKAKRKEGAKESDPFRKALLESEQLAYKLTANSLYGQLGSGTFKIRLKALAASVTAYGRKQIMFAKEVIETTYGPKSGNTECCASAQTVYGDSVKGDTAIYIKRGEKVQIVRIDELVEGGWSIWHDTKEAVDLNEIKIWTDKGWTKVERVIRHRLAPGKKMFRVLTHTGIVDCTDDHSLVAANGLEVKPHDVSIGTELLHNSNVHKCSNVVELLHLIMVPQLSGSW
jgi:DNA polymerase elongation subunit (family B)